MLVYRIARGKFIQDLTGESASRFGGRWNRPGVSIIYTSGSIALAAFAFLVSVPNVNVVDNKSLNLAIIEIPDNSIEELNLDIYSYKLLSSENYRFNAVEEWVKKGENICLKVPSEIIEGEFNILINTKHPLAEEEVVLKEVRPFLFDKRAFGKLYQS